MGQPRVIVYVTRPTPVSKDQEGAQLLDLLVLTAADVPTMLTLPETSTQVGESPTEAAWRCAVAATGFDVFFTFRKLKVEGVAADLHFYQTSPEVELPETLEAPADPVTGAPRRGVWLREQEAATQLPPALAAGFARLRGVAAGRD